MEEQNQWDTTGTQKMPKRPEYNPNRDNLMLKALRNKYLKELPKKSTPNNKE